MNIKSLTACTFFVLLFFLFDSYFISVNCQSPGNHDLTSHNALPDIHYEYCITELNAATPVNLEYNQYVKEYIDIYATKRFHEFEQIITKSEFYFPVFEYYLDKYQLPLELKYVSIIESGLNPSAVSRSGAVGLWQFLTGTCELVDLEVNSYIDERRDVYKSTEAACKYFSYLYRTFGDWHLVLAAYNGGPGEVRKAIERSGGKLNYWELRPYLSLQAQKYVPAFIAVNYLFNNYRYHSMFPDENKLPYTDIDTIKIGYPVSFEQISTVINYSIDSIRILNPSYIKDYIPDTEEKQTLILPADKIYEFLSKETAVIGQVIPSTDYYSKLKNAGDIKDMSKVVHIVKQGEFFHKIAMEYNCTIENIKAWNNLDSISTYPGQELIIYVSENN